MDQRTCRRDVDPTAVLRRAFGYPAFRPGQEELVRAVLSGRDALGVLPTGGGKSVCYQVPALIFGGLTLVVTPLISLMEDQVARAREAGLRAALLSASQPLSTRRDTLDRLVEGGLDTLFVSPERLATPDFVRALGRVSVDLVAVDEAHCISQWGHDFRPAYRHIGRLRARVPAPLLALTASATPAVRADIVSNLRMPDPAVVVRSFDRENLWWAVRRGGSASERLDRVLRTLRSEPGCAIVYAPTRRSVERTRDAIARRGLPCGAYHAGLPGGERSLVQERFMDGTLRVVVATNAFGMGVDKPDVRTVLHLQLPATLEAYYQEAGRAGRDGAPARCVAFHARSDRAMADGLRDRTAPRGAQAPSPAPGPGAGGRGHG